MWKTGHLSAQSKPGVLGILISLSRVKQQGWNTNLQNRSAHLLVLTFLLNLGFFTASEAVVAAPVTIEVEGMRTGKGFLAMSLFAKNEKSSFPSDADHAVKTFYLPLDGKTDITIPIDDLEDGEYAISVMHDEAADHKMHFNFVGIPVEGFGFSNNPRVYFGPPSFERAKIHLSHEAETFKIKMKYFL